MLNLYANPFSPFGQKVHFFLEEAKIPYKYNFMDLAKGAQSTPEFLKLNPFGVVPAIELNGFSMGESNAILRYLADRYEKTSWYPTNLEDRARVDNLVEFCAQQVNPGLMALIWNLSAAPMFGMPVYDGLIAEGRRKVATHLPKLEAHLAGRTFLVGATMTIADATLVPFVTQHKAAQVSLADFPNIKRWHDRMVELPSYQRVLEKTMEALARLRAK